MLYRILFFSLFVISLTNCSQEEEPELSEEEQMQGFISATNSVMEKTASGMYYVITKQGSAPFASANSTITVRYRGFFLDGRVFDSSGGNARTFELAGLIRGWEEFIPLLGTGGEGTILLPSSLAYGSRGSGSIPPNTPIGFEIELIEVR